MEWQELLKPVLDVVPVLIGGIIALGGAYIGPWTQYHYQQRERRFQKFDELISALYEHRHWLDLYRYNVIFGENNEIGSSPLPRALAICAAHFPQMLTGVKELMDATTRLELAILEAGGKRLKGEEGDAFFEPVKAAYPLYIRLFTQLITDLTNKAPTLIGTLK